MGRADRGAALAKCFIEHDGPGGRHVQGTYSAGHGNTQQVIAGAADKIVKACSFPAQHDHAVAGQIELVVVRGPPLVESDDP